MDWLLLTAVIIHAFLGVRTVILDYVHAPACARARCGCSYVVGLVLFILGTQVIVTLPVTALTGPM